MLLAAVRTSNALLYRMADGNVCFSCVCSVFFFFTQFCFVKHPLAVRSHCQPRVEYRYALSQVHAYAGPQAGVNPPRRSPLCTRACAEPRTGISPPRRTGIQLEVVDARVLPRGALKNLFAVKSKYKKRSIRAIRHSTQQRITASYCSEQHYKVLRTRHSASVLLYTLYTV